jgi:hypothetical protein
MATKIKVRCFECMSTGMTFVDGKRVPCPTCGGTKLIEMDPPKVGDKATYGIYTDAIACEVIAVSKSGKQATLRECTAKLLNGAGSGEPDAQTFTPGGFVGHTSGTQRWEIKSNPNGIVVKATLRKNGIWKLAGHRTQSPGMKVTFGVWNHHHDHNF